ncbi:MAG: VCBS repeat-containing protein, partial [Acidobacteria bacterium]|nr:VCBS repeat-containing protein [Acidobacteriota bacterium]
MKTMSGPNCAGGLIFPFLLIVSLILPLTVGANRGGLIAGILRSKEQFMLASGWRSGVPQCAPGILDPSFGSNGIVSTPVSVSSENAYGAMIQPDGKTIVVGLNQAVLLGSNSALISQADFVVTRLNPDGSFDPGFGDGGKVFTDFGTKGDSAQSAAYQPDGKIVVAGFKSQTPSGGTGGPADFALARYNPDGSLDQSFGAGGKVVTDLGGSTEQARSVAIQPDGKIIVGGSSNGFGIARYNPDGSLDPTFGVGGFIRGSLFSANKMALQPDGRIVTTGAGSSGTSSVFVTARFNTDGSFDESFGNGGFVQTDIGAYEDTPRSVAIAPDGKIVVVGVSYHGGGTGSRAFATVRYNVDGTLDTSFGGTGMVVTDQNPAYPSYQFNEGFTVAVQSDSRVVVAGTGMVRYNANGTLDTSFGTNGGLLTNPISPQDITVSLEGRIVAVGSISEGASDIGVLRYTPQGTLDQTFASGGLARLEMFRGYDAAQAIVIQQDGKIIAGGGGTDFGGHQFAVARYNLDGSLDTTFSDDGKAYARVVSAGARGIAVQQDGKVVAVGVKDQTSGSYDDFALVRWNADGSADTTFGPGANGIVSTPFPRASSADEALAVAIQSNGKILAAGYGAGLDSGSGRDFALARYNSNGVLDPLFGTSGLVLTPVGILDDVARAIEVQPDGKILLAGIARPQGATTNDFALVRYNANGTVDTSFGTGGKVLTPIGTVNDEANAMALQPDGKIVVAGFTRNGTVDDFALVRYGQNGSLDTTFGTGGKLTLSLGGSTNIIRSVKIQDDEKIVAVGSRTTGSVAQFAVARFNADGSLDTSFGLNGTLSTSTGESGSESNAVAIDAQGMIVAAGFSTVNANTDFTLMRYFGTCGTSTTGETLYDYDGDGKADLTVRRPSNNIWYLLRTTDAFTAMQWGLAGDRIVPADYDGDGRTDIAVFRPSEGKWYIFMSQTGAFQAFNWGQDGDLPVPTDRDNDGKTDLVVYRESNNTWYASSTTTGPITSTVFGSAGDKPVVGDFDGDGRGDEAVFRPSNSTWYVLGSAGGFIAIT